MGKNRVYLDRVRAVIIINLPEVFMIVRIKTDNGFYDSMVFAYFKNGFDSSVIVFNKITTR